MAFLPCAFCCPKSVRRNETWTHARPPSTTGTWRRGGRSSPSPGWLLPVQYSGVIAEHKAVRSACGLFDVSHMGELLLRGSDALENVNRLMTNDFSGMAEGQARYSPMCYEDGGTVDDLIVYKCSDTAYFIVVNAANKDKDAAWIGST